MPVPEASRKMPQFHPLVATNFLQMASLLKIGDTWRAQIRRKGHKSISETFPTKAQAVAWARKIEAEMDARLQRHSRASEYYPKRPHRLVLRGSPDDQGSLAMKARGTLLIWLDKGMCWHGSPNGKRGRGPKYSEAAIQFCLAIKGLFTLALRQAMGMAQSLLELAGLDHTGNPGDRGDRQRRRRCADAAVSARPDHRKRQRRRCLSHERLS